MAKETNLSAVTDGKKILTFKFRSRVFKDSSLFIARPLESFTKTFGLGELKKGYFCHSFNRPENFNYIGPYPNAGVYKPEFFSKKKKEEFEKWHENVKNTEFDFQKEIREYCWSDVSLLAEGCIKFSEINKEASKIEGQEKDEGIDPLESNLTISSFCNKLYRKKFMKKNSIAWVPSNGHDHKQQTSFEAINWLKYVSEKENIHIQHARNGGEKRIGKYLVDGFAEKAKKIYEYQGCLWHGCEKCLGEKTFNPVLQCPNYIIRKRTETKINYLKSEYPDYEIVEIWGHDWHKLCKKENLYFDTPKKILNPRVALYGGRTNALVLNYLCRPWEKIHYFDFCSLYPAVQKYGIFPKGHAKIITENFDYNFKYFGLIKCKVIPPRGLHIPVLPVKINGKLLFPLCKMCAIDKNMETKCSHNDEERSLEGTWVSLEHYKALEKGYKLIEYYSIYHFEEKFQYDRKTKKGGLFTSYVNANLKEKVHASGFPDNCQTEEETNEFIKTYLDREGIFLDKEKMKINPGKREIEKIKLNSLWVFFALNSNKAQFKIISNRASLENLLNDDQYIVQNIDFNDENFAQVTYSLKEEYCTGNLSTNVVIANFVTAQGRLKLYEELEKLNQRVLYFDTGIFN